MIKNRIEKNLKRLKSWAMQNRIEAYRIYDWDIPEYPFQIDRYGTMFLIHDKSISDSERDQQHLAETQQALMELFSVSESQIILKRRFQQRTQDNKSNQYHRLQETNERIVLQEGDLKFYVNLQDYIDTGLFLDHRPLRRKISKNPQPSFKFLNLFSYTCSMSVAAAKAGMQTVSVDMSEKYLNWGKDNFRLNDLDPQKHLFLTQNALMFLEQTPLHEEFDLIFLDPPTFSNSKKMHHDFEVERDQIFLIQKSMQLLKPTGTLLFSNNKKTFKLNPQLQQNHQIQDITPETIPQDFQNKRQHHCFKFQKNPTQ